MGVMDRLWFRRAEKFPALEMDEHDLERLERAQSYLRQAHLDTDIAIAYERAQALKRLAEHDVQQGEV
jgi:hypothetical protein